LLKRMPGLIQADFMSLARGSGFDLQHIQPYQEGDDVRRIDWHASARSEQLQIRQMQEDREFTAWLVVDLSASSAAGFDAQSKRDQVIALSDCVIESIAQHGNRIGLWIDDGRQTPALRIKPGEQLWVDADDPGFRARFADAVRQEQLDLQQWLRQSGARLMQISHQDDALRALSRWMRRRS
ncbi:MAG: DUF58 domain-containing protein, partial [Betaproteobacteria bacterium]|nr:DUF58 domain-containing protein [Betaproteobacteria bacterium]